MTTYERLREQLNTTVTFLPDKPEENVDNTLRALWLAAAGTPVSAQRAEGRDLPELDAAQLQTLQTFIAKRSAGMPLAHLTGRQQFLDLEMLAGPDALVPRKETELLASAAIALGRDIAATTVIDVCTGSGNVALAIGSHLPEARVAAADLSEAAVELARRNAEHLGLGERVQFSAGDLLAPFDDARFLGCTDLLTCNPPYIATSHVAKMPSEISAHEPRLAFDGGALGIGILMRLIQQAPRFLRAGGWLAFEVGLGQGPAIVKRLHATPAYKEVRTSSDDAGAVRVVMARC